MQLYLNRAGIRPDYANYIFAKHKTDSAISYSHYTRFYTLIWRVCIPAKTWGFSSNIRDSRSRFTPRQATASSQYGTLPSASAWTLPTPFRSCAPKQPRTLTAPLPTWPPSTTAPPAFSQSTVLARWLWGLSELCYLPIFVWFGSNLSANFCMIRVKSICQFLYD